MFSSLASGMPGPSSSTANSTTLPVVRARTQDDSDGWQGVAQRLTGKGKPIPYRSVRTLLRTSYAHWARPLD